MRFTKMHGLGNDFIVIDAMKKEYFPTPDDARRLCNRRTGIGADGLMLVMPSQKADLRMRLLNSDGSTAEMCGNGIRCFAKFAYERGMVRSNPIKIETPAGIKLAELTVKGGRVTAIRVDMGEPLLDKKDIPMKGEGVCRLETIEALGREFTFSAVNTGVPHMAVFGEVTEEDILKFGPALERHPLFPAKVNVNFINVEPDGSISVRTWERGCGRTLACGTGSCAAAAALACCLWQRDGACPNQVRITVPEGRDYVPEILPHPDGSCGVLKDSGDDPDITKGMEVVARVEILPVEGEIEFCAGEGVGTITQDGLKIPRGQAAINPVPRQMISDAVRSVYPNRAARVTISIPGGREIAKKTFNPRLGIVGGLSILGTSGVVRPMSEEALKKLN